MTSRHKLHGIWSIHHSTRKKEGEEGVTNGRRRWRGRREKKKMKGRQLDPNHILISAQSPVDKHLTLTRGLNLKPET